MEAKIEIFKDVDTDNKVLYRAFANIGDGSMSGYGSTEREAMTDLYNRMHKTLRELEFTRFILGIKIGKNKYSVVKNYADQR